MCGIVGQFRARGVEPDQVRRMCDALLHRGPDGDGVWHDHQVAFGHRRLAIIDLSADGRQPMVSANERYVLTYNGEIYNYDAIRAQLPGTPWRGHSDTEVLLEAIARWGLPRALEQCIGMFALALYDREQQVLHFARDRLGIKPLYLGWLGDTFVFTSELHPLRTEFASQLQVDRGALAGYLRHYYTPGSRSIFAGIEKLAPGHIATLPCHSDPGAAPLTSAFWSAEPEAALPPNALPANAINDGISDAEYVDRFIEVTREAVRCRMVADVPLGAFLSGGLDSSFICALMSELSDQPINTFTMGFNEPEFDEAPHAAAVAAHLGCRHHEDRVGEADLLGVIEQLPTLLDEPFADSSLIPTLLVCRNARRQVTVALSGDGGDELLWGYTRYGIWQRLCRLLRAPTPLRHVAAATLQNGWVQQIAGALPAKALGSKRPLAGRLHNLGDLLRSADDMDLYHRLVSTFKHPEEMVLGASESHSLFHAREHWLRDLEPWRQVNVMDLLTYLPGDILTKVDRASMAVSLEARVPLLDHRVVAFCNRLPREQSLRDGRSKWLLRQAIKRYVPDHLIDRPKKGFGVPIDAWLRGPLREWMSDLLAPQRLRADGYLNAAQVERLRSEHLHGRGDWGAHLWSLCLFQVWRSAHG